MSSTNTTQISKPCFSRDQYSLLEYPFFHNFFFFSLSLFVKSFGLSRPLKAINSVTQLELPIGNPFFKNWFVIRFFFSPFSRFVPSLLWRHRHRLGIQSLWTTSWCDCDTAVCQHTNSYSNAFKWSSRNRAAYNQYSERYLVTRSADGKFVFPLILQSFSKNATHFNWNWAKEQQKKANWDILAQKI